MQHAQHKHNICIYIDDKLSSTKSPSRVKNEELEPGEINTAKMSCDDDDSKRSEQGHSPSVHSSRTLQKEGGERLHRSSMSAMTPPRDMSIHSQQSTPRSIGSTTPPPLGGEMLPGSGPSSLMFRMPHPDRQISPGTSIGPFSRPPHEEFRLNFGLNPSDPFQRMPGIGLPTTSTPGFEPQIPGITSSNPFERHLRPNVSNETPLSGQDFYSQRLRQLAGTTSPSQESPQALLKPHTPPFSQPPSTFSTSPTEPPTPGAETSDKQEMPPGKLKACEFCGKCFRFQSNLIVHRRSHTGEKPFKCPLCPHACSQASKLKRHMKTHNQGKAGHSSSGLSQASSMSTTSDNSGRSTTSTPDSKLSKLDDETGDDTDEDSEDEEAGIEESRKKGYLDEPTEAADLMNKKSLNNSYADSEVSDEPTDLSSNASKDQSRASLLTEVMEKTGLNSIAQYSEAFQQALEESTTTTTTTKRERENSRSERSESVDTITENGHDDSELSATESRKTSSVASHGEDYERLMNEQQQAKRIKLEPEMVPHGPPHIPGYPMMDHMWRTWVPPSVIPRELFPGAMGAMPLPPEHFLPQCTIPRQENGHGESAFRIGDLASKPTGSGLASLPNHSGSHGPNTLAGLSPMAAAAVRRSDGRTRNDTCEFCGKVFKNCSNLTVHRRSHTGEKPYKCTMCSYACAQSSKLTRHMKTHGRLGKDVYNCKFCNMPFSVPSTLEKHMRKCVENQQNHHVMAAAAAAAACAAAAVSSSSQTPSIASSDTSIASSPAM